MPVYNLSLTFIINIAYFFTFFQYLRIVIEFSSIFLVFILMHCFVSCSDWWLHGPLKRPNKNDTKAMLMNFEVHNDWILMLQIVDLCYNNCKLMKYTK